MEKRISSFKELRVYQAAFELQQQILEVSKGFPIEERFALTDQIRRSSDPSAPTYPKLGKNDGTLPTSLANSPTQMGREAESQHWMETAAACHYVSEEEGKVLLGNARGSVRCWEP